jgi:hypothetical protein
VSDIVDSNIDARIVRPAWWQQGIVFFAIINFKNGGRAMDQRDVPTIDFKVVKQVISVPDVLDAFGLLQRFEHNGDRLSGPCPLPEHAHSSPVPNTQQFRADCRKDGKTWEWFCFGSSPTGECPQGGDVVRLIFKLGQFSSYSHVRLWLWKYFSSRLGAAAKTRRRANDGSTDTKKADEGVHFADDTPSPASHKTAVILPPRPEGVQPLTWFYAVQPSDYLLTQRRFRPETLEYFGKIGVATKGWAKGRIAIPLFWHDQAPDENPVSYLSRYNGDRETWDDEQPKYRFYDGFSREEYVYGLREALANSPPKHGLVVCEGCTDVWRLWQEADVRSAVATLGCGMTDKQAAILAATGRDITMLFDGNAQTPMRAAAAKLIAVGAPSVRMVYLPENRQPDDLTGAELRQLMPYLFT